MVYNSFLYITEFCLLVFKIFYLLFIFWLYLTACRILVPQSGIELEPPALEVQSLNHWTIRKIPICWYFAKDVCLYLYSCGVLVYRFMFYIIFVICWYLSNISFIIITQKNFLLFWRDCVELVLILFKSFSKSPVKSSGLMMSFSGNFKIMNLSSFIVIELFK